MKSCGPVLYYEAGQTAIIVLENTTSENLVAPQILAVFNPNLRPLQGYPLNMFELSSDFPGVYVAKIQLPSKIAACGTYLCIVGWKDGEKIIHKETYTIIVKTPTPVAASAVGI